MRKKLISNGWISAPSKRTRTIITVPINPASTTSPMALRVRGNRPIHQRGEQGRFLRRKVGRGSAAPIVAALGQTVSLVAASSQFGLWPHADPAHRPLRPPHSRVPPVLTKTPASMVCVPGKFQSSPTIPVHGPESVKSGCKLVNRNQTSTRNRAGSCVPPRPGGKRHIDFFRLLRPRKRTSGRWSPYVGF